MFFTLTFSRLFRTALSARLKDLLRLFCLSVLFLRASPAQEIPESFRKLTRENGLSSDVATAILQDRKGFIWIGTADGLNKYDGYTVTVFRNDADDRQSLSNDVIAALAEDKYSTLWAGTAGGGINAFNRNTNTFRRYLHSDNIPNSICDNKISSLFYDGDATLWIGAHDGKFSAFNIITHSAKNYSLPALLKVKRRFGNITAFVKIDRDRLGIAAIGGFYIFNHDANTIGIAGPWDPRNSESPENYVATAFRDSRGNIWIGTLRNRLFRYSIQSGEFKSYALPVSDKKHIDYDYINSITEDAYGRLWLATVGREGLYCFNPNSGAAFSFRLSAKRTTAQAHPELLRSVKYVFIDNGGNLWVSTWNAGVDRANLNPSKFSGFMLPFLNPNDSSKRNIWAIRETKKKQIWLGSNSGIHLFDRGKGIIHTYSHIPGNANSLSDNDLSCVAEDKKGRLWFGTWGGGVNVFDPGRGIFEHYREAAPGKKRIISDYISALLVDKKNRLWIGTQGDGLQLINLADGSSTSFVSRENEPQSLSSNDICSIREDSKGQVWVTTWSGGLNKYLPETNTFFRYRYDANNPRSISSDLVFTIQEDNNGNYWVGTSNGLNLFDINTGTFRLFTVKHGLAGKCVGSILPDGNDFLWLGTDYGISRFSKRDNTFRNYSTADGLLSMEFNLGAFVSHSGEFFFSSTQGVNFFRPEAVTDLPNTNTPILTAVKKFNVPVQYSADISDMREITFGYAENTFSFDYSLLDFTNPEKYAFMYMLEGQSPKWIFNGNHRSITLSQLPPGSYTLKVKASNSDGQWSNVASLRIHVLPPFWRTWWFVSLLSLALVLSGILLYKRRLMAYSNRQKELEEEVAKHTIELWKANRQLQTEIAERKKIDGEERRRTDFIIQHRNILLELAQLDEPDFDASLAVILKHTRDMLRSNGACYWVIDGKAETLTLKGLHRHGANAENPVKDIVLPASFADASLNQEDYLSALKQNKPVFRLRDGSHIKDPTVEVYAAENKIALIADVPVWFRGEALGVLSIEDTVSSRELYPEEEDFLTAMATMISLELEAGNRKAADAEMKRAIEKERELGLLRNRFVSMASHEFRTPLTSILTSAEILEKFGNQLSEDKRLGNLARIQENVHTMSKLLNDILFIGKSDAGKLQLNLEMIDLEELCESCRQFAELQILNTKSRHSFHMIPRLHSRYGMLDSKLIRQVLENLITNAFKYSPDGKSVSLSVESNTEHILFCIEDDGIGIPEADLPGLFTPFFRASNTGDIPGTGLGLVIIKRAIELHGGTVDVISQEGKGTAFTLIIPARENEPGLNSTGHEQEQDKNND